MGKSKIKSLKDLKPDQKNARKHNPRNIGMISDALREVGAARSGVIDEEGNILAGNGTYEALSEAGIEKVKVVEADGNEWVVVQRKGLSAEEKKRLALFDNRTQELSDWEPDVLGDFDKNSPDLLEGMFTDKELSDILPDLTPKVEPEVPFSQVLGESNNYVILKFDNDIDWLNAKTHFKLESVNSYRSNGKPWSRGIGRVLDGGKYLNDLGEK